MILNENQGISQARDGIRTKLPHKNPVKKGASSTSDTGAPKCAPIFYVRIFYLLLTS